MKKYKPKYRVAKWYKNGKELYNVQVKELWWWSKPWESGEDFDTLERAVDAAKKLQTLHDKRHDLKKVTVVWNPTEEEMVTEELK